MQEWQEANTGTREQLIAARDVLKLRAQYFAAAAATGKAVPPALLRPPHLNFLLHAAPGRIRAVRQHVVHLHKGAQLT